MSEAQSTTVPPQAEPTPPRLQSSSGIATATASGGFVGALVVIICGLWSKPVTPQDAAALMVVLTPIVHWIAVRMGNTGKGYRNYKEEL